MPDRAAGRAAERGEERDVLVRPIQHQPSAAAFGRAMISPFSARHFASPSECHPDRSAPLKVTSGTKFLEAPLSGPVVNARAAAIRGCTRESLPNAHHDLSW